MTHELTGFGGERRKKKISDSINRKIALSLQKGIMAKKFISTPEFSPLESAMEVVCLQVASSGTGGNLLD